MHFDVCGNNITGFFGMQREFDRHVIPTRLGPHHSERMDLVCWLEPGQPVWSYGTQGTPAAGNTPGGRDGGVGWTDNSGNFWLFGGIANPSPIADNFYPPLIWAVLKNWSFSTAGAET